MKKTMSRKRWEDAQRHEAEYWDTVKSSKTEAVQKQIAEYWKWYLRILTEHAAITGETKILEIGCGPDGLINYIGVGERYGIDPLMGRFLSSFKMQEGITWLTGTGESLPFPDGFFDAVITTNALDHMVSPANVLKEIRRVCRGVLFLTVDCHQPCQRRYKQLKELLRKGDGPHPHTFSVEAVKRLLKDAQLSLVASQEGIGDLGEHSTSVRVQGRQSTLAKASALLNERGVAGLTDAAITKALSLVDRAMTGKSRRVDWVFVAKCEY
jgi:SAM-dependent methyltransferase